MKKRNIFVILMLCILFAGCDDLFSPAAENIRDKSSIYEEPAIAEGLLANGYLRLPDYETYSFNDVATDNAVTNDLSNSYLKMASGIWASDNNPMDMWTRGFNAILYMNLIISEANNVPWAADLEASKLFNMRIKGEAYGLRALFYYYLLQAHAGYSNGQLLGVPIIMEPSEKITDFNIPRATFKTCVDSIYKDLDAAEKYLPMDYNDLDVNTGVVPAKYVAEGVTSVGAYNRVLGTKFRQRISARIVKAIRARVALLAASQAFLNGENNSWEKAAEAAADVLNNNNGITGLSATGYTWYTNDAEISAIVDASNPPEILWRYRTLKHTNITSTPEKQLFPPTLNGNGRINPSQNFVDAFPMKNGYPISAPTAQSGYNKADPYKDRDPRLAAYVVTNGSQVGASNTVISMTTTNDAVDAYSSSTGASTRTGYYLRKLTNKLTNLTTTSQTTQMMYVAKIRYTELYLIYAEAAFEAYGFEGKAPGASYSAYDVIKAIRKRAGVGGTNDPYLESVRTSGDPSLIRQLIHNERRLELSFEGYRFWDLRRWKEPLNEKIRGIKGKDSSGAVVFDFSGPFELTTETRNYKDYMYYGPIPYSEILKYSNLKQNDGWN